MKSEFNHIRISRRQWLARTSCATTAALVGAPLLLQSKSAVADEVDLEKHPWIDAHSHIWSHDVESYPLAHGNQADDLTHRFSDKELLDVAHANGVGRVVLIQHHQYHGWDNSYLTDTAVNNPKTFRVVGMVDNLAPHPGRMMRNLLKRHVTGFRITSGVHQEKWLAGGMDEMWKTAADTGQNICCLINPKELAQIDAMCAKHPSTPVVIDHFARVGVDGMIRDADVAALVKLAKHKNTTLKISAYYALGKKRPPYLDLVPMIRRMLDAYGPERLMWASDSPYQLDGENSYKASISLVRDRLDFLSAADRDQLLRKTAERVFFSA